MKWNELDGRLRKLYNAIVAAHNEQSSPSTTQKAEEDAWRIMEELTKELQCK